MNGRGGGHVRRKLSGPQRVATREWFGSVGTVESSQSNQLNENVWRKSLKLKLCRIKFYKIKFCKICNFAKFAQERKTIQIENQFQSIPIGIHWIIQLIELIKRQGRVRTYLCSNIVDRSNACSPCRVALFSSLLGWAVLWRGRSVSSQ